MRIVRIVIILQVMTAAVICGGCAERDYNAERAEYNGYIDRWTARDNAWWVDHNGRCGCNKYTSVDGCDNRERALNPDCRSRYNADNPYPPYKQVKRYK